MPQPVQGGEFLGRLRRSLLIDAGFPLSLDEIIVPVTQVVDSAAAPYRTTGRMWVTDGDIGAVDPGAHACVGLRNAGSFWLVVTGFRARFGAGFAAGDRMVGWYDRDFVAGSLLGQARDTESGPKQADILGAVGGEVRIATGTPTGTLVWVGHPGTSYVDVDLAYPIVLPPGPAPFAEFILEGDKNNLEMRAQFWGYAVEMPVRPG